ncbi:MAG: universal stress protein [Actinobacteria bacterium]|nr:universal stress protein [Actinomycetota bacterium]
MHVVVATDGQLAVDDVVAFAAPLAGEDAVTVLTAVVIPRNLLTDLRTIFGEQAPIQIDADAEYVGSDSSVGSGPTGWPGDDAIIERYLGDKRIERCKPITDALKAQGIEASSLAIEGTNAAKVILEYIDTDNPGAVITGTHGQGLFEGLLGSTSTRVARHAKCAVILIRTGH